MTVRFALRSTLVAIALVIAGCAPVAPMPADAAMMPAVARILDEAGAVANCPQGRMMRVTCSPTCGDGARSCANAPVIRVCDAGQSDTACMMGAASAVLGEGSANCGGPCTGVTVLCPDTGAIKLAGYNMGGGIFVCAAQARAPM